MWRTGLVALQHVGSSRTRDRTRVPCIGRRFLTTAPPGESGVDVLKALLCGLSRRGAQGMQVRGGFPSTGLRFRRERRGPCELVPSRHRTRRPLGTDPRPSPAGLLWEACGTESRKTWEGGFQDSCWDAEGERAILRAAAQISGFVLPSSCQGDVPSCPTYVTMVRNSAGGSQISPG